MGRHYPRPFQVVEAGPVKAAPCDWIVQGTHDGPWVLRVLGRRGRARVSHALRQRPLLVDVSNRFSVRIVGREVEEGHLADSQHDSPCFPRVGHLAVSSSFSSRRPTSGARIRASRQRASRGTGWGASCFGDGRDRLRRRDR